MTADHDRLLAAIAALEAQRAVLGDAVAETALAPLSERLAALTATDAVPAETLKQVTILFLDVVGSTALAGKLDPEDTQAIMDGALARFTQAVRHYDGKVMNYAGDSMLAVFGAEQAREDDAERAVRCGLALLDAARDFSRRLQSGHEFDVRVGAHTGDVMLGGGMDGERNIRGNAVNVAARMEQSAPPGRLRISQDAFAHVRGLFDVEEQRPLLVKGVDEPLTTYLVTRARPHARHARGLRRGIEGAAAAMVGRANEIAELHALAKAAFAREGLRTATVLGEGGLGKSRLLAEFHDSLLANTPADGLWLAGAHPQARHQPGALLRELLLGHFGVADSDSQQQAQERFTAALRPMLPTQADEHIALLGHMMGLDFSRDAHVAGILQDAQQLRARGLHAFVEVMRRFSAQQPLVLLVDDVHWADDESLDALDHLVRTGGALSIALVFGARPELLQRRPSWGSEWPGHRRIDLAPLAGDMTQSLARALMARIDPASPRLEALLATQAAGNPYYMEALLQMLIDTQVIRVEGERWQVRDERLQSLRVPSTLVGVLQATLDALAAGERRSLQQASIVGPQFWDEALAAIDTRALDALPVLASRNLALPQSQSAFEGACEYAFRHHLLHQVTYGTVLKRNKREGHGRAARWLETRSAGREGEVASQIAEHYERAGDRAEALRFWMRAAEDASRREADSATLAAVEHVLALDDGSDLRRSFALQRMRGDVFRRQGLVQHELECITALESLAERLDDDGLRLHAASDRVFNLSNSGNQIDAVALGEAALARAIRSPLGEQADVHSMLFIALSRLGRRDEALAHGKAALEKARLAGNRHVEATILNNMGVNHQVADRLGVAQDHFQEALRIMDELGSRYAAVGVRLNIALVVDDLGRLDESRDTLLGVLQQSRETGYRRAEARAHANLAHVLCELGDFESARESARHGIREGRAVADRSVETHAHGAACKAAAALGAIAEAREHAREAVGGYLDLDLPRGAWECRAAVAAALSSLGEPEQASAEVDALLAEAPSHAEWNNATDVQALLYRTLARLDDPRAHELLVTAYGALSRLADMYAELVPRAVFMRGTVLRRELCAAWEAASVTTGS
ncbi:MAG TPA: adenylate/guanylate cyclase domain-containing protein [Casimicrobiaceae bacterium]|nr:adenylate/guanylate cyclase domain-containing protein [Casimicrobiaceae bacterium]